jgi:serine/threonine-protein kinase HipA
MRTAKVYQQGVFAGTLEELDQGHYRFAYAPAYDGEPVSLTMPVRREPYEFQNFPAVFEGLLPEGLQLEALLRRYKVDRGDLFSQLLIIGADVVGSLSVLEAA